jgi:HSP20 family protein
MAKRRDMERLQNEVEELFADLWQLPRFVHARTGFRPPVDYFVSANRERVEVVVELAGVEPEQLTLAVEAGELLITGERRREREEGRVYHLMEIDDGPFERRIPLTPDADVRGATARFRHGLLTVTFPLAERPRRRAKVLIQVVTR